MFVICRQLFIWVLVAMREQNSHFGRVWGFRVRSGRYGQVYQKADSEARFSVQELLWGALLGSTLWRAKGVELAAERSWAALQPQPGLFQLSRQVELGGLSELTRIGPRGPGLHTLTSIGHWMPGAPGKEAWLWSSVGGECLEEGRGEAQYWGRSTSVQKGGPWINPASTRGGSEKESQAI